MICHEVATIFVDGLDGLQHVLPVQLSLQWIHSSAFLQPPVQIQVSALHQHVYIAAGYLTAMRFNGYNFSFQMNSLVFYDANVAVLTSHTA